MFRSRTLILFLATACALAGWRTGSAQTSSSTLLEEDFDTATTANTWYFYNDACLTASGASVGANPGTPPGCTAIDSSNYGGENLVGGINGVAGASVTLPDPSGYGALRFTNGCIYESGNCNNGGYYQNGAVITSNSYPTDAGLDITFKTVTYRGNSLNTDGADGMSFFLQDASIATATELADDPVEAIGEVGGSLGYSCSNTNTNGAEPYHGMVGGYLGMGIDEYGNFLNPSDNTASGPGYQGDRIGLRGPGDVAWDYLTSTFPNDYPSTLTSSQQSTAVLDTCKSGTLWNFSNPASPSNTGTAVYENSSGQPILNGAGNEIILYDYQYITGAYAVLSQPLATEYSSGGYSRNPKQSIPITYRLQITPDSRLSMYYSINGAAWHPVVVDKSIASLGGQALPANVRFGFAGSSGAGTNIHELLCFKVTPNTQAASSTTINQQQSSEVKEYSQAYFAYYDPTDWTGRLTANPMNVNTSTGALTISSTANWDASCNLTGIPAGSSCPTTGQNGLVNPQSPTTGSGGRVILSWIDGTGGIPFEWSNLSSTEQSDLNENSAGTGSDGNGQLRLNFLRGDRTEEQTPTGGGLFRDRDSVLADIVDSNPAWVGPPSKSIYVAYETPNTWADRIQGDVSGDTITENSGATYANYVNSESQRLNVVYVGADDGLLHGFAAGSFDPTGTIFNTSTNTGDEVLAYMPEGVLDSINTSQNSDELNYTNPSYVHAFYVDAPPGTGDLFYNSNWHSWLVGGLGAGGSEIYALDITNPTNFTETNSASLVIGDWQRSTLSCTNVSSCGNNLGFTYGTPVVRRLHNGDWAIIFGNGLPIYNCTPTAGGAVFQDIACPSGSTGSLVSSGDAGIYVITLNPSTGQPANTYYFTTGVSGGNGIAYVTPMDMDGDHIVDYVYAGDLKGNVWRFDLTSASPSSWGINHTATPGAIFTTASSQPITSEVYPVKVTGTNGATYLMLFFGTGEKFPLTADTAGYYQSGQQAFYGVWDWNMSSWNALNSTQYASLTTATMTSLGFGTPYTLAQANLAQQTLTASGTSYQINSTTTICWAGTTACGASASSNKQFGWFINLPGSNSDSTLGITTNEQVIYNPIITGTAIEFNSVLPALSSPLECTENSDEGWSYAFNALTGGPVPNFFNNLNNQTVGIQTNASGSSSIVTTVNSSGVTEYYMIYQSTSGGPGTPQEINPGSTITGVRETWVELR
jgi:type IV pilus assembly protein PilY1